jgi:hypothetical protein
VRIAFDQYVKMVKQQVVTRILFMRRVLNCRLISLKTNRALSIIYDYWLRRISVCIRSEPLMILPGCVPEVVVDRLKPCLSLILI